MRLMEGIYVTKTPRIRSALTELRQLIAKQHPTATFTENIGGEPIGFYLEATVDVDDTDDVFAAIVDRLIDIQVEEGLPIYVVVHLTPERREAQWREHVAQSAMS